MDLLNPFAAPPPYELAWAVLGAARCKDAADVFPSYSLSGQLYAAPSGYVLLAVPNALVRGAFSALDVSGVELPPSGPEGGLNAHVTVFRPEEVAQLGGIDRITERGKRFAYTLGRLVEFTPDGWPDMDRCYAILVHSPALQELRRSYGLSSLPNEGRHAFHVTVAVRRRGVLGRNDKAKGGTSDE